MPTLAEKTIKTLEARLGLRTKIKRWEYKLLHAAYLEAQTPKEKRKFPGKMLELDPPVMKDAVGMAITVGTPVVVTSYSDSTVEVGKIEKFTKKRVAIRLAPSGWKAQPKYAHQYPPGHRTWLRHRLPSQIIRFTAPLDASKP